MTPILAQIVQQTPSNCKIYILKILLLLKNVASCLFPFMVYVLIHNFLSDDSLTDEIRYFISAFFLSFLFTNESFFLTKNFNFFLFIWFVYNDKVVTQIIGKFNLFIILSDYAKKNNESIMITTIFIYIFTKFVWVYKIIILNLFDYS